MFCKVHHRSTEGRGQFSRRRFLAATGAALGAGLAMPAIAPASALGADGAVAPSNRIRLGMIGLGRQCLAFNLWPFLQAADVQVVALCDVDRWRLQMDDPHWGKKAKTEHCDLGVLKDCFRTTDFREVLARKDIDAVFIGAGPLARPACLGGHPCRQGRKLREADGALYRPRPHPGQRGGQSQVRVPHRQRVPIKARLLQGGRLGPHRQDRATQNHPVHRAVVEHAAADAADNAGPSRNWTMTCGSDRRRWRPTRRSEFMRGRNAMSRTLGRAGMQIGPTATVRSPTGDITSRTPSSGGTTPKAPVPWKSKDTASFRRSNGLWNVMLGWDVRCRYASGVEVFYANANRTPDTQGIFARFEGTEGWVCVRFGPERVDAEPKSILTAQVKREDFPFPLKHEKRDFLDCVKTRGRIWRTRKWGTAPPRLPSSAISPARWDGS